MGGDHLCTTEQPCAPLVVGFLPAVGPLWPLALLGMRSAQHGACVTSIALRAALCNAWHFLAIMSFCTAKISCAFAFLKLSLCHCVIKITSMSLQSMGSWLKSAVNYQAKCE